MNNTIIAMIALFGGTILAGVRNILIRLKVKESYIEILTLLTSFTYLLGLYFAVIK